MLGSRSAPKKCLSTIALALAVGGPGMAAVLPGAASAASAPTSASSVAATSLPGTARAAALLAAGRTPAGAPLLARRHVASRTTPRALLGPELDAGQTLAPGDSIADPGGRYSLVNDDGAIVVRTAPNRLNSDPYDELVFSGAPGSRLVMQDDGNLVLYSPGNEVQFNTGTGGTTAARLIVQGDGNLVLYGATTASVFYDFRTGAPADLLPGGVLLPGDRLTSTDGTTSLLMQTDGNLVLYAGGTALFATGTRGTGIAAVVQGDDNVVLYDAAGAPVYSFATGFGPTDVSFDVLEVTSGEFRVLNVSDAGVLSQFGSRWGSDTLLPGQVLLPGDRRTAVGGAVVATLQADGNFVEYVRGVPGFRVVAGADFALMQPDGNLVLYRLPESGAVRPVFNTRSGGNPGSRLVVQSDGNLVVYTPANRAVYASRR